ncbi:MAG TPA: cytidylate kinase-like family protein [Dehalococcoidia bacterium]|nr:cytidylate kinase-like family protein [Dehalococcoidia bacterium]
MTAATVTFSVQLGSGGFAIARAVAEKLGYRYYDWEVTSQAAEMAGVSPDVVQQAERVPGFLERIMRRLSTAPALTAEEAVLEPAPAVMVSAVQSLTLDDYRQFIERVVRELADKGEAVIVGHAAQAILRERPGVFKVLILGSLRRRSERLAAEQGVSVEQAMATIKQSDKDRAELFKRAYHIDWLDAAVYDLCINTDTVPVDVGVEFVSAAARAMA